MELAVYLGIALGVVKSNQMSILGLLANKHFKKKVCTRHDSTICPLKGILDVPPVALTDRVESLCQRMMDHFRVLKM